MIGEIDPAKLAGGDQHVGRGRAALRTDSPDAPRHLRHERTAGTGRTGAGRLVQHSGGTRRADPRLPDPLRPRRADSVLGQPGHLQPQRQGDPATEGPHRFGHPHALSARARLGHRDHGAGGRHRTGRRLSVVVPYFMREIIEQISIVARRSQVHRPAVGRQRPVQHRQLSHDGRQRPAAGGRAGRTAGRATHQRPGAPRTPRRWASWNWT